MSSRAVDVEAMKGSPAQILSLPVPIRDGVVEAFARSMHAVFLWTILLIAMAFLIVLFLSDLPLRESAHVGGYGPGEDLGLVEQPEFERAR